MTVLFVKPIAIKYIAAVVHTVRLNDAMHFGKGQLGLSLIYERMVYHNNPDHCHQLTDECTAQTAMSVSTHISPVRHNTSSLLWDRQCIYGECSITRWWPC